MNAFVNAVSPFGTESDSKTFNNAATLPSSGKSVVDLFFIIGSSRGKDITNAFVAALKENEDLTLRTLLWVRDVRQGAGERSTFRSLMQYLEKNEFEMFSRLLHKIPELGRFDDLLIAQTEEGKKIAFSIYAKALEEGNGLAGKWAPRKGKVAAELREFLGLTPKKYRKTLVALTKVVENQMCAKEWTDINYNHVPSIAAARYRKAFYKHDQERYASYVESLSKKETGVKVNAGAIYPHDVIHSLMRRTYSNEMEKKAAVAQWESLPNYITTNESFLPMVDVSGSMTSWSYYVSSKNKMNVTPLEVAVSLGLYTSERNKSAFKDTFLTFSSQPKLQKLSGNISDKINQLHRSEWQMSTNLEAAFQLILNHAIKHNVPQEDMPSMLMILSDMEFDACARNPSVRAFKDLENQYANAGYEMPKVVFWNLNGRVGNVPVSHREDGTALVSGFSPSIMTSLLSGGSFDPLSIVQKTICKDRYNY